MLHSVCEGRVPAAYSRGRGHITEFWTKTVQAPGCVCAADRESAADRPKRQENGSC